MEETDDQLLRRYRRGDLEALEELIERYRRPLFAYLLKTTEGRGDVDELFQEVWLRVIRKVALYKPRNFFGWLIRIAHNLVIDRVRKRKPELSLDVETGDGPQTWVEQVEAGTSDAAAQTAAADLGTRIESAIDTLPPEQKEVFVLRSYVGLSFKEIAATQKVSINTALARMQYALAKLRPMLEREYDEL